MKIWTFQEAYNKLVSDQDLEDQTFILMNEMIGKFNDAIEEAESEILKIDEDYLLKTIPFAVGAGVNSYPYPADCYAFKIRNIQYTNGSIIYALKRFPRYNKFERIAFYNQYASGDDYRWYPENDSPGNATLNFAPTMRDAGTVAPTPSPFSPFSLSYIRHVNRVPLIGEYVLNWDQLWQQTSIASNTLTTTNTYVTGDQVKLNSVGAYGGSVGSMPGGLAANTVYYVIVVSATQIKLATTLQNALASTAITISSTGTGILSIAIAAQQTIVNATLLDVPESTKFIIAFVKHLCMDKEGDPRYEKAEEYMEKQRAQMVATLTDAQPDDQNQITPDLSAYTEMS